MKTTAPNKERFLTDAKGRRTAIVLDLPTYDRLRQAEEELAEVRDYDAARPLVRREMESGQFSTLAAYRAKRSRGSK